MIPIDPRNNRDYVSLGWKGTVAGKKVIAVYDAGSSCKRCVFSERAEAGINCKRAPKCYARPMTSEAVREPYIFIEVKK